jgi:hypothetical protein
MYTKPSSLKSVLVGLLAIFRYNPSFKETNIKIYEQWKKLFDHTKAVVEKRYEENKPSERQTQGYVPFEQIITVRDQLPAGHIHRVLLDMYTHVRPMRCEYARIALYKGTKVGPEPNYIHMRGKSHATLVIQKFKTAKTHGKQEVDLAPPLVADLHLSLQEYPREWLFVNTSDQPYSPNQYVQWTMRVFKKLFKRPLSVALIRHAYINTLDFNTLTIKDKKEIATAMGHTVETQDRYRLLFDDKASECDCVCKPKT